MDFPTAPCWMMGTGHLPPGCVDWSTICVFMRTVGCNYLSIHNYPFFAHLLLLYKLECLPPMSSFGLAFPAVSSDWTQFDMWRNVCLLLWLFSVVAVHGSEVDCTKRECGQGIEDNNWWHNGFHGIDRPPKSVQSLMAAVVMVMKRFCNGALSVNH